MRNGLTISHEVAGQNASVEQFEKERAGKRHQIEARYAAEIKNLEAKIARAGKEVQREQ